MSRHVVLVDDDAHVLKAIKRSLRGTGWRVSTCASAEEAIAVFQNETPDLLLTDIRLSGMSGLQLARRIKINFPQTPIIVFSGSAERYKEDLMALQPFAVLDKPFPLDALIRVCTDAMNQTP